MFHNFVTTTLGYYTCTLLLCKKKSTEYYFDKILTIRNKINVYTTMFRINNNFEFITKYFLIQM